MHSQAICMFLTLEMIRSGMAATIYMEYRLSADDLPYTDINAPDGYCKVQMRLNGGSWAFEGQTETDDRTEYPKWRKEFQASYKTGEVKEIWLKIYDKDYNIDDYLGEYVFNLNDLANINGNKVTTTFVSTKRNLFGAKPTPSGYKKPSVTISHRIYSIDGANKKKSVKG